MSAPSHRDPYDTFCGIFLLFWMTVGVLALYACGPPWVREGMLLVALGFTTAGLGTALLHPPRP